MRAKLGQNFLIDESWQKKIASHFHPSATFGEIGPGKGELTQHLKAFGIPFYVFEKDEELFSWHRNRPEYKLIPGDFLDFDFKIDGNPIQNFSFVGNLPYESGTPIVKRMAEHAEQVTDFLFLLQKEVVDRLCAKPKSRDYGSLSVMMQGQFKMEALDVIPPEAFRPAPKVFSQLVKGKRREDPHPKDLKYWKFIQASFLNKRKVLKNVWKSQLSADQIHSIFQKFDFPATIRAEEIDCELWPKLYEEVNRERRSS